VNIRNRDLPGRLRYDPGVHETTEGKMKLRVLLMAFFLISFSGLALADEVKVPNDSPIEVDRTVCLTTDHTGYPWAGSLVIPDGAGTWVSPGTIAIPAGQFSDIMIDMNIAGTWVGDLIVEVYYDRTCDGVPDVGPVSLLCRANLVGCDPTGCCGCSGDLAGVYTYSSSGLEAMGEPTCPTSFPTGNCYLPAPESLPLTLFNGEASGGCFSLRALDAAAGDVHTLNGWEVWVKCSGPVPAGTHTWGQVKSIYR
jgi:hypothetical protein